MMTVTAAFVKNNWSFFIIIINASGLTRTERSVAEEYGLRFLLTGLFPFLLLPFPFDFGMMVVNSSSNILLKKSENTSSLVEKIKLNEPG